MGSNIVRLIRSDHRKISGLLERAGGPHRNGEELREEIVAQVRAHALATEQELLPYVGQRLDPGQSELDRHLQALESLAEAASDFESVNDEDRSAVLTRLSELVEAHIAAEERDFLHLLDETVDVARLRRLGETFRRRRDGELKLWSGAKRRLRRPDSSRAELYERARRQGVSGRSKMTKSQLKEALREGRDR